MAVNKAKRSIHLAQQSPQNLHPAPAERMPVKAHVYRAMAEMNGGFEQGLQALLTLQTIKFFPLSDLISMHKQLSQMQSQTNRQLLAILIERETANADHFQQLLIKPEKKEQEAASR
jgi:hypothetical protein